MRRSFLMFLGLFILLMIAVTLAYFTLAKRGKTQPQPVKPPAVALTKPLAPQPTDAVTRATTQATAPTTNAELSAEDIANNKREAILEPWQSAMDDDDATRILAESMKLMKNPDPEIRSKVVEGLNWVGPKGLVALTDMMYDSDPEVAREAAEAWVEEMRQMENDDATKAELIGMAAADVDRLDEDTLNEMLSLFPDISEHQAAPQLYEMLKASQNPDYIREIINMLEFVIQPGDAMDGEDKAAAMRIVEQWLKEHEGHVDEKETDE